LQDDSFAFHVDQNVDRTQVNTDLFTKHAHRSCSWVKSTRWGGADLTSGHYNRIKSKWQAKRAFDLSQKVG
jgi:hypothetical protein